METIKQPILVQDLGAMYPTTISKQKARYGIYRCECGVEFKAQAAHIKNRNTKSCGCYKKIRTTEANTTHGYAKHPIYQIWASMLKRCYNANSKYYRNYGGRGVTVCDRWKDSSNFIEDMLPSYIENLTLDRINNDGNYEPSNCRWTTRNIQARNTRVIQSNNKSGYRGVSWKMQNKKWIATIRINKKEKHLGCFITALEAARAYDKYVLDNNLEHTINGVLNA